MNKFSVVKVWIAFSAVFIVIFGYSAGFGADFEIPSSFNPVGSGARAIGRGGAFIAVADDATAASWNPGGLTQLKKPETSVVFSGFNRKEDIEFGTNPEADGLHSVSETNINYLSATYPFELFNRNMVVSLSYQHLYDFNRDWNFMLKQDLGIGTSDDYWNYKQDGSLSALGLSYCVRVIPRLSMGFTLNFWNDDLTPNKWEQSYNRKRIANQKEFSIEIDRHQTYSFKGFNANIGILWQINYHLTFGAVLKTPFEAKIEYYFEEMIKPDMSQPMYSSQTKNDELTIPMSYGFGMSYNVSDNLSLAADVYKTEWDSCIYKRSDGQQVNPFNWKRIEESDIKPTYQIRAGTEYLFIDKEKGYIFPIRAGIFYDPAPSNGSPDNIYGFSIGAGFTKNDRFSVDIAYQYRFGNDVGKAFLSERLFSQDVKEHTLYVSAIFYKF